MHPRAQRHLTFCWPGHPGPPLPADHGFGCGSGLPAPAPFGHSPREQKGRLPRRGRKDGALTSLERKLPPPPSTAPSPADKLVVGASAHIRGRGLTAACRLSLQDPQPFQEPYFPWPLLLFTDSCTWKVPQASVPGALSSCLHSRELSSPHSCDRPSRGRRLPDQVNLRASLTEG